MSSCDVLDRQVGIDVQRVGDEADERDRLEVLDRIVGQVLVQAGVDRVGADRAAEQRVAVGLGLGDLARADARRPAPGLLSTTTGCFNTGEIPCAMVRPMTSVVPPGVNGTMYVIGFDG